MIVHYHVFIYRLHNASYMIVGGFGGLRQLIYTSLSHLLPQPDSLSGGGDLNPQHLLGVI